MSQKTKQTIIAIVIIIIAFVGFRMFFTPDTGTVDQSLFTDATSTQKFIDGQAILVLLNRLNKVTLDESIFADPVFKSLVSFARTIPDQVAGRNNPFAPIGADGSSLVITATSTVR